MEEIRGNGDLGACYQKNILGQRPLERRKASFQSRILVVLIIEIYIEKEN